MSKDRKTKGKKKAYLDNRLCFAVYLACWVGCQHEIQRCSREWGKRKGGERSLFIVRVGEYEFINSDSY